MKKNGDFKIVQPNQYSVFGGFTNLRFHKSWLNGSPRIEVFFNDRSDGVFFKFDWVEAKKC